MQAAWQPHRSRPRFAALPGFERRQRPAMVLVNYLGEDRAFTAGVERDNWIAMLDGPANFQRHRIARVPNVNGGVAEGIGTAPDLRAPIGGIAPGSDLVRVEPGTR